MDPREHLRNGLKGLRGTTSCTYCDHPGHIARYCPYMVCANCEQNGYQVRDCPNPQQSDQVKLYFPQTAMARIIAATTSMRNHFDSSHYWPTLPNAPTTFIAGNCICADGNAVEIAHDRDTTIIIALQDNVNAAETLIQVRHNKVKVDRKFIIKSGELKEKVGKAATGCRHLATPDADMHILIVAADLFDQVLALEVYNRKFYIEWSQILEDGQQRMAVYVSSDHTYAYHRRDINRFVVREPLTYFDGIIWPKQTDGGAPAEVVVNTAVNNNDDDENNAEAETPHDPVDVGFPFHLLEVNVADAADVDVENK